jgi:RES domain-containing protein
MMIVFRLSKEQFAQDLSGKGAELVGGRWNSREMRCCTSQSIALCVTEIAVHVPLGFYRKIIN